MSKRCVFLIPLCCLALVLVAGWLVLPEVPLLDGVPFSRVYLDRDGRLLRITLSSDEKYRIRTPLKNLPAALLEATLLYEDRHFYRHPGVNPAALLRAGLTMLTGGRRMGGSTITMQVARLRFNLNTGNVWGKVKQMGLALCLERHYDKKAILEAYFNLAPYGGNVEGAEAAARVWFGKTAEELALPEILALVTVPQNPVQRNPPALRGRKLPGAAARLQAMWLERHPEDRAGAAYSRMPMDVRGPSALPFEAPHLITGLERTGKEGLIRTTLDLSEQRLVERAIDRFTQRGAVYGLNNAAAILVHWPDMQIRALVGSADFGKTTIQGQVDGTAARRSPGSTLKPFIYALALDQGLIHPLTLLADTPRTFAGYEPENADGLFRGPLSAREALTSSRNIPAISLAAQLQPLPAVPQWRPDDPCASAESGLYSFLCRAGVRFQYPESHYGLALVLGGAEVSMRELAMLYAMLPNQGLRRELNAVLAVNAKGKEASVAEPPGERMLSPEAALIALDMLGRPIRPAMPGQVGIRNLPVYWKTGTSNGQRDAWTAGVFGPFVLVVWVGNFDGSPNPLLAGEKTAAPLFFDIVEALGGRPGLRDKIRPLLRRAAAGLTSLNVMRLEVCADTGDPDTSLCPKKASTWYIPGVSPLRGADVYRSILVDRETGLRECRAIPGRTEEVIWEFWPTDLERIFRQAGVIKPPPPPYAPHCLGTAGNSGRPPEIVSPKPGLVYNLSLSRPGEVKVPLSAVLDADASGVFWFADKTFIGRAGAGETLFWEPGPGTVRLHAVDDLGRSSYRVLTVDLVP